MGLFMRVWAGAIVLALVVAPASATIFTGVDTSVSSGMVGGTGGFFVGGTTGTDGGGPGVFYDSRSWDIGQGAAFASADHDGNNTGDAPSPVLKGSSTGVTDGTTTYGSQSYAGAMVEYQYNGTGPGTVTYTFNVTATLVEPVGTSAFLRARAALITNPDFYDSNYSAHFESSANVLETYNFTEGSAAVVDESGSISYTFNPGDYFYLLTALTTQAGKQGASSDASSTFLGDLTVDNGTLTLIPEPTSLALLAIGGVALVRRRR